jgi:hypothetical protein
VLNEWSGLEEFAEEVISKAGYAIKMRDRISNIVVAVRDEDTWRWNLQLVKKISKLEGVPSKNISGQPGSCLLWVYGFSLEP